MVFVLPLTKELMTQKEEEEDEEEEDVPKPL